jgi:tellurite methyltransferase
VLDLGSGEGRNSFFLAQLGHDVTAVDRSEAGIHKLLTLSQDYGVAIKGIVQDIADFPFDQDYDLIMAHGVLYYLDRPIWQGLLSKVKEHTRQGGYNIFTVFVYSEEHPCVEEIKAADYRHSFQPGELKRFYQDWHELRSDDYVKWDAHPGIPLHYHPIEKLVAQRPLKKMVKEPLEVGDDMEASIFHNLEMGIFKEKLIELAGLPSAVEKMPIPGIQMGQTTLTTQGYNLELWYYGKYVVYVVNGEVSGRALYATRPLKMGFGYL